MPALTPAEMSHGWRRYAHLRDVICVRVDELEVSDLYVPAVGQLSRDGDLRRGETDPVLGVRAGSDHPGHGHPVELLQEVEVEVGPSVFPVGDALDSGRLEFGDHRGDRPILDLA